MEEKVAVRSGGQILVDALKVHGVDLIFGVPGESFLPALDALYDHREDIRFVTCRQEGGAAYMAEAYGKMTGRPGVCFVTRGPGATNASIGIHMARQGSTPLVLLIGQVRRAELDREAHQELDYARMYGHMTKWVAQIERVERIPEMLSRAFHLAVSGRPGPVVLALPEDMLAERVSVPDTGRYRRVAAHPGKDDLVRVAALLRDAQRPLMVLGGAGWTGAACKDIQAFAETWDLPVACTYRCQDLFDNRHPNYAGDVSVGLNPALEHRIRDADVLLVVGARLDGWTTSGYTLVDVPRPRQRFIHVHPGAEELGRIYQGELLINSGMPEFAAAARELRAPGVAWSQRTKSARSDYVEWIKPVAMPGPLNLSEIVLALRRRLPENSIVTCGAGAYIVWMHRFFQYTGFRTQLGPTGGAMGYGAPSAIAAKLVYPERQVVCFTGDGCFLMNAQELATARQQHARILYILLNNGIYGTIRMNQERQYPGRVIGTDLANPDFVTLAHAYGLHAERVQATEAFEPALERALGAERGALIELVVDPDIISPRATLSGIRKAALSIRS